MELNNDSTLEVSMITYLKNIIEQFPEVINGKAMSPVAEHLFTVRDKKEINCSMRIKHWHSVIP